jgi:sugar phosphate isomerase/epimerase
MSINLSRRGLLIAGASLAPLALDAAAFPLGFPDLIELPTVGLQLHAMGKNALLDPDYAFGNIVEAGYREVELLSFAGGKPRSIRDALTRHGLKARSTHALYENREGPNFGHGLGQLVDYSHIMGVEYVVASVYDVPPRLAGREPGENRQAYLSRVAHRMTAEDWRLYADTLNKKGAILNRHGLTMAHHNHYFEFKKLPNGECGYDIIVRNTDPALVTFQLDVEWAAAAGHDPMRLLRQHQGRFSLVHMRPGLGRDESDTAVSESGDAMSVTWGSFAKAAKKAGVTNYYTAVGGVIHA